MAKFIVRVWDEPYLVTTNKRSKTVWVASGAYMGQRHSVQDRTEGAAVSQWRTSAQYKQYKRVSDEVAALYSRPA